MTAFLGWSLGFFLVIRFVTCAIPGLALDSVSTGKFVRAFIDS